MSRTYFGTDGIRGTVGTAPITPDFMLRLGHAVGQVLRRAADKPTVLIGKDTRISGYMIESALEAGFASAGVDVLLSGPLPTPGVAYLTRALRLDLGVVISASHNAYPDNGVKFFSARGEKLPDAWEHEVEAMTQMEREAVADWLGGMLHRPPLERPSAAYRPMRALVEALWWDIESRTPADPADPDAGNPRLVANHPWGQGEEA